MFELFGKKEHTCPMCEGTGKVPDPETKFELRLGEDPARCEPNELALVMAISGEVATVAEKLGIDPTQIKTDFKFQKTGHHMCFTLGR